MFLTKARIIELRDRFLKQWNTTVVQKTHILTYDEITDLLDTAEAAHAGPKPIPIKLNCPNCGASHVDEGEFATKAHHTHACQTCGLCWRPAIEHTVGVQFLPGFKNEPQK